MKNREEILGIILPDKCYNYLLPNVSIAEVFILESQDLVKENSSNDSNEFLGTIEWRNNSVQLFHLSKLIAPDLKDSSLYLHQKPRIAVLNPIQSTTQPHYAILATEMPRLTRITSHDLNQNWTRGEIDLISFNLKLGNDNVIVPNLVFLEKLASTV